MRKLLLGDEAIAQAAIDSGLSGVYAYPGTPSTEITEFIQLREEKRGEAQDKIFCRWATNEKTAMEGALGMSYMGKRALVCMKHVGMNVAADPFVNSAMTGVNGGLVVVAADDPSMHSSQNEQDSRFYGKFAMMPIFEPSSQQEAYEMTRAAFELSEAVKLPVLMRVTTRMAHSRAVVEITDQPRKQNDINRPEDVRTWILLPAFAKKRYVKLLEQQDDLMKAALESKYNFYRKGEKPELGVICTGIAYNYYMENCAACQERSVFHFAEHGQSQQNGLLTSHANLTSVGRNVLHTAVCQVIYTGMRNRQVHQLGIGTSHLGYDHHGTAAAMGHGADCIQILMELIHMIYKSRVHCRPPIPLSRRSHRSGPSSGSRRQFLLSLLKRQSLPWDNTFRLLPCTSP